MDKFIEILKEFISFKSISTDSNFKHEINNCAKWLQKLFIDSGYKSTLISGYGNDIVYSEIPASEPIEETVLIYGHYDVQPANITEGWSQDPFDLYEENDKLFGRGVVDNKGQILIHIYQILQLAKAGKLKQNIKFIIEGNEETGSPNLEQFIEDHKSLLKCDYVFFSDGELTMKHPTIETGFRGIANLTLEIITSSKDNHSGLYGGGIPNSAIVSTILLSKMYNEEGIFSLPELDNSIDTIPQEIINNLTKIPFNESNLNTVTGIKLRNSNNNFYILSTYLTSAEITSITSGYQGEGYRNAIPGKTTIKINFRISPRHSVKTVLSLFDKFVKNNLPKYADYNIIQSESFEPIILEHNNVFSSYVKDIASKIYQKECLYKFCGAIVPIAGIFKKILKVPVVSIGLGNEDCNMHGVNENFDLDLINKGLLFSKQIFQTK